MAHKSLIDHFILWMQRTLLIWLVAFSWVAYSWPNWFPDAADPFSAEHFRKIHLHLSIVVTMFAVGVLLPRDEVDQVLKRWTSVLTGTGIQYISMPLLAYLAGRLWGLEGPDLIGVAIVGCVPGAMASNILTMAAEGNTSYSVSLTTSATLLSPLAAPLALWAILSSEGKITPATLLNSSLFFLITVVAPVVVGHLIARALSQWELLFRRVGTIVANLAILLIIAVVVGRTRSQLAESRLDLMWTLLFVNVGGYLVGYFGGMRFGLPEGMRRALTLEVGMQNAGVGTVLAIQLFEDRAAIGPAMYTFGCMLTGTVLALIWSLFPVKATPAT